MLPAFTALSETHGVYCPLLRDQCPAVFEQLPTQAQVPGVGTWEEEAVAARSSLSQDRTGFAQAEGGGEKSSSGYSRDE